MTTGTFDRGLAGSALQCGKMKRPAAIVSQDELHQMVTETAHPVVDHEMPADKLPAFRGRCRSRLRRGHQLIY